MDDPARMGTGMHEPPPPGEEQKTLLERAAETIFDAGGQAVLDSAVDGGVEAIKAGITFAREKLAADPVRSLPVDAAAEAEAEITRAGAETVTETLAGTAGDTIVDGIGEVAAEGVGEVIAEGLSSIVGGIIGS